MSHFPDIFSDLFNVDNPQAQNYCALKFEKYVNTRRVTMFVICKGNYVGIVPLIIHTCKLIWFLLLQNETGYYKRILMVTELV